MAYVDFLINQQEAFSFYLRVHYSTLLLHLNLKSYIFLQDPLTGLYRHGYNHASGHRLYARFCFYAKRLSQLSHQE